MNEHDYPNEGSDSEEVRLASEAVVLNILESWFCRIAAVLLLVLLVASQATATPPVILLELLVQAAFNHPVVGTLWFAQVNDHYFMFLQQVAFTVSSLIGIWVWLVKSRVGG